MRSHIIMKKKVVEWKHVQWEIIEVIPKRTFTSIHHLRDGTDMGMGGGGGEESDGGKTTPQGIGRGEKAGVSF